VLVQTARDFPTAPGTRDEVGASPASGEFGMTSFILELTDY